MPLTLDDLKDRGFSKPVRVIHTICGAIVFFTDGVPKRKEGKLNPYAVVLVNGGHPKEGDPIYCQGCGYGVRKNQLAWVIDDNEKSSSH